MSVLAKIWALAGWFYFSLLGLVIFYFRQSPKSKKTISAFIMVTAAILAFFTSTNNILRNRSQIASFFAPLDQKIEKASLNQYSFSTKLKEVLPNDTSICIAPRLPAPYLSSKLYPYVPHILGDPQNYEGCKFLISQLEKYEDLNNFLILEHKGNYLYKLK